MSDPNEIEVGIRIDPDTGVAFFGVEAVNRQLKAGRRIAELRPGGAIFTEVDADEGHVTIQLRGCDLEVVFVDED